MYILFDLGRTKLRIAETADKKNIDNISVVKSPPSLNEAIDLILAWAEKKGGDNVTGFTGGVTAILDKSRGQRMEKIISQKSGRPAFVGNDSEIVGLGEAVYGAGMGYDIVQYITVSTGIGGARIKSRKIDPNSKGFEPGNQIIDYLNNQTLQELASGSAIAKKYGKPPKEIDDGNLWPDLSKILAVGIYNSILHWMPDVVVLGGSMITGDPAIPVGETEKNLISVNKILEELPPVKKAALGDHGGIYGSLALVSKE